MTTFNLISIFLLWMIAGHELENVTVTVTGLDSPTSHVRRPYPPGSYYDSLASASIDRNIDPNSNSNSSSSGSVETITKDNMVDFAKMTVAKLESTRNDLRSIDVSGFPQFEPSVSQGLHTADMVISLIENLINEGQNEGRTSPFAGEEEDEEILMKDHTSTSTCTGRERGWRDRRRRRRRTMETETNDDDHNNNINNNNNNNRQQQRAKNQNQKGKLKDMFGDKHSHLFDMVDAVHKGDHVSAGRLVRNLQKRARTGGGGGGGDENQKHRRRVMKRWHNGRRLYPMDDDKRDRCLVLIDCVDAMTYYDMVVYFYSDDIDPDDGTIDSTVFRDYDESDLIAKYDEIKRRLNIILDEDDGESNHRCDRLLEEFHRNVEYSNVGFWEGATVSQVCLASGTTIYVQLTEIASQVNYDIIDGIVKDMIDCTRDLYKAGEKTTGQDYNYPFPFGGAFAAMGNEGSNYCIPETYNTDIRNEHGQIDYNFEGSLYDYYEFPDEGIMSAFTEESNVIEKKEFDCGDGYTVVNSYTMIQDFCFFWCEQFRVRGNCKITKANCANWKDDNTMCESFISKVEELNEDNEENCKRKWNGKTYYISDVTGALDTYVGILQNSFELIYGDEPSPGYVCGMKDAVVNQDPPKELVGSCCLDAPYEEEDEFWGAAHDCDNDCQTTGPFLAGLTEEACGAHGGTFCPNPHDCSALQSCIEDLINEAEPGQEAFAEYLSSAPTIDDYTDYYECAEAREYFGFQGEYINDDDICDEIEELQYTRDFTTLSDFFNQGSEGEGNQYENDGPVFVDPTESWTEKVVQNGAGWKKRNFALEQILNYFEASYDVAQAISCPSTDVVGACPTLKGSVVSALVASIEIFRQFVEIGNFQYEMQAEVGNIEPMEMYEHAIIMRKNMGILGEWEAAQFYGDEETTGVFERFDALDSLLPGFYHSRKFAGCDGIDQNLNDEVDECEEDDYPPSIVLPDSLSSLIIPCDEESIGDDGDGYICLDLEKQISSDEIEDYFKNILEVTDDCGHPDDLSIDISNVVSVDTCGIYFDAMPVHECKDDGAFETPIEIAGSTKSFYVVTDNTAPIVTCEWTNGETLDEPNSNIRIVDEDDYAVGLFGLSVTVEEECSSEVSLEVTVMSNTAISLSSSTDPVHIYQYPDGTIYPFVFGWTCASSQMSGAGDLCSNPQEDSFILYHLVFVAEDETGNRSDETICGFVVTNSGSSLDLTDVEVRFTLQQYTFTSTAEAEGAGSIILT